MVQRFRGSMVQRFNVSEVQWFNGSMFQRFNGSMVIPINSAQPLFPPFSAAKNSFKGYPQLSAKPLFPPFSAAKKSLKYSSPFNNSHLVLLRVFVPSWRKKLILSLQNFSCIDNTLSIFLP